MSEHKTLAEALAAAQADMPSVDKDSVNPHFKSRFTSLDHLIAKTRPVLNKHGLSISQWPSYALPGDGAERIVLHTLTTRLSHITGEDVESTMALVLGKNDMQGLGAALTYAKRYAWSAALGISTDEDDDGNQASQTTAQKPAGATETASQPSDGSAPARKRTGAASEAQVKMIHALIRELAAAEVATVDALTEYAHREYGVEHITDLTGGREGQASNLIERLQRRLVTHLYGELVLSDQDDVAAQMLDMFDAASVESIKADQLAGAVKAMKEALRAVRA